MTELTMEALAKDGWQVHMNTANLLIPSQGFVSVHVRVKGRLSSDSERGEWAVSIVQGELSAPFSPAAEVRLDCGVFETLEAVRRLVEAVRGDRAY